MSSESENNDEEIDVALIQTTTMIIVTPETEENLGVPGTFQVYTVGMKDNYDMPDLEMRGLPHMFTKTAARTLNEINAYRLTSEKPVEVGNTMSWHGEIISVTQGEDWDGRYQWKAEDMLRLTSRIITVKDCVICDGEDQEE